MTIAEKVIDIIKGMEGIGGVPTDKEFLDEFESRLQALKQGQSLPLDSVVGRSEQFKCACGSTNYQKNEIHDSIMCNECNTVYTNI